MSSPTFVHLHVHTEYSLVDSTVRIPALMQRCADDGMPAVALTDQNNLFAMVKFYTKAITAGVKPIIGVDVRIFNDDDPDRPHSLILLCQNNDGYRNLSRLLTRGYIEERYRGDVMLHRAWLTHESCDGLIALSGGLQGDIGHALTLGHVDAGRKLLRGWCEVFGGRFYLELIRTGRPREEDCVQASLRLASEEQVPVVASNDVRFVEPDGFNSHEARVCIQEGRTLADTERPRLYSEQQYLRSSSEMSELFADVPDALANSVEISKRCNLNLTLGESVLPAFPVPEGQDEIEFLEEESRRGLRWQLDAKFKQENIPAKQHAVISAPYLERLTIELDVIRGMGYPGYFLIVADFIRWARETMYPSGPDVDRVPGHSWRGCLASQTSIPCITTCCSSAS